MYTNVAFSLVEIVVDICPFTITKSPVLWKWLLLSMSFIKFTNSDGSLENDFESTVGSLTLSVDHVGMFTVYTGNFPLLVWTREILIVLPMFSLIWGAPDFGSFHLETISVQLAGILLFGWFEFYFPFFVTDL